MSIDAIGSSGNVLSNPEQQNAPSFVGAGETAPTTDNMGTQWAVPSYSGGEEGIPLNFEGTPTDYGSEMATAGQGQMPVGVLPDAAQLSGAPGVPAADAALPPLPDPAEGPLYPMGEALPNAAGEEAIPLNFGGTPTDYGSETAPIAQGWMPEIGVLSDAALLSGEPGAPSADAPLPPLLDPAEGPSSAIGEDFPNDIGEAPPNAAAETPSDDTTPPPAGEEANGAADGEVTQDELRNAPDVLSEAGTKGLEVTGMELSLDSNGMLSEGSKAEVNELVGYMSDALGGVEVLGDSYVDGNGNVGLHLTSGNSTGVYTDVIDPGTVYNVHTHPGGNTTPSQIDLDNEISGAEDAIIGTDGTPGNEDGSNYDVYG